MDRFYLSLFLQGGLVTFFIICLLFLTGINHIDFMRFFPFFTALLFVAVPLVSFVWANQDPPAVLAT